MMDSKQIEIEWMKELLKENELEIWRLRKEIKNLKEERDFFKEQATLWRNDYKNEYEKNKKLKDRIDVLFEFIERNDKLVDEVIDEEDLDKLNRYIYIDDDLVDRALESED